MSDTYLQRRSEIGAYFDRTAAETWKKLTSDAPVGRIRATVRKGRDQMRATLLSWLPQDLRGSRILDAGCGTGALALELAARGADVVAVDLSPQMIATAAERMPPQLRAKVAFQSGDMTSPQLGIFDYCVAMDSLIHYEQADMLVGLQKLAARTERGLLFTFAPRTTLLAAMHGIGQVFPRGNRSPAIVPHAPARLMAALPPGLGMQPGRSMRVTSGFYISQAQELLRL